MKLLVQIVQSVSKPALSVLFTVLFSIVITAEETDGALMSNTVLPAGTVLAMPLNVMEEYQAEADFWGRPFNYLSYYYFFAGPDLDGISKSVYYFPLSREDGKNGWDV